MTEQNLRQNIEVFHKLFGLDERTKDALIGDVLKRNVKSSFLSRLSINPWYVRLISIIERCWASTMSRHPNTLGNDFVFVSCIDPVHRVKTLPLIAKDFKYTLFFLPTVTRPTTVRTYYRHYKTNSDENVYFGTFSWNDVREYERFLKNNAATINEILCDNEDDTKALREYAKRFALYDIYAKRVFGDVTNDKLWLFEHDKFFFIPVIRCFKDHGVQTIQLQHGTFINSNKTSFFPLYSDKVICCSEREARIYESTGVKKENIYVLGAPLQTLVASQKLNQTNTCDLLILLTIAIEPYDELQKVALSKIRSICGNMNVRVRFRPRSMNADKIKLGRSVDGYEISEFTSLTEDVSNARYIISFSYDAAFEVIRLQRPLLIITTLSEDENKQFDGLCCNMENLPSAFGDLIKKSTPYSDTTAIKVFGEVDPEKLRLRFAKIIENK